jgi:transposase-like protein
MKTSTSISRAERLAQVRAWTASGLSAAQFAPQVGASPSTLAWWRWKLRREGALRSRSRRHRGRAKTPLAFVEIAPEATAEGPRAGAVLELQVADVVLRIPEGFEERTLARVLQVLRGPR